MRCVFRSVYRRHDFREKSQQRQREQIRCFHIPRHDRQEKKGRRGSREAQSIICERVCQVYCSESSVTYISHSRTLQLCLFNTLINRYTRRDFKGTHHQIPSATAAVAQQHEIQLKVYLSDPINGFLLSHASAGGSEMLGSKLSDI